ncbi:MAG: VIT domain-containing protein [Candidatus Uhrbacteria bacterium]
MAERTQQRTEAENKPLGGIPLRSIAFDAEVIGLQSRVTVRQAFGNKLARPVEAVYIFPLPAEASVIGVEMQIGDRKVVAELRKREDAVQEYRAARDRGHHAALVEQERKNIFTVSVGGIEPGEEITVMTTFTAPVDWQDSGGRFRVPLVVAPRFIPGEPTGKQGGGWAPDTDQVPDASRITPQVVGTVPYTAALKLLLKPGFPAHIESPSHTVAVRAFDLAANESRLIELMDLRPDCDIVVTYKTTAALPTVAVDRTVFTAPDGAREEFVLLQLTPGTGQEPTGPLDVVLVLDRSGSMDGTKTAGMKQIAEKVLDRLLGFRRKVRVGVIVYDTRIHRQLELAPIDEQLRTVIRGIPVEGGGGTETPMALDAAMAQFGKEEDERERCIILVTDGQVGVEYRAKTGVRIHVVGIDTAVNDDFLNDLARRTGGGKYFLRPGEDYDAAAAAITAFASGPVVRSVELRGLPEGAVVTGLADLYASRPTTIIVKLPQAVTGFTILGRGTDGKPHEWPIVVPAEPTTELGSRLWAKARIRAADEHRELAAISLRYGIICATTAFVAVSLKEKPGEQPVRVDVPVLLPEAWDHEAVFGGVVAGGAGSARRCAAVRGAPAAAGTFVGSISGGVRRSASPRAGTAYLGGTAVAKSAGPPADDSSDDTLGAAEELEAMEAMGGGAEEMETAALLPNSPPPASSRPQPLLVIAEAILASLKANDIVAEAVWKPFCDALAIETFKDWSELDRARLYEVLVEFRAYARRAEIPEAIVAEPADVDAYHCWQRARRGLGIHT